MNSRPRPQFDTGEATPKTSKANREYVTVVAAGSGNQAAIDVSKWNTVAGQSDANYTIEVSNDGTTFFALSYTTPNGKDSWQGTWVSSNLCIAPICSKWLRVVATGAQTVYLALSDAPAVIAFNTPA